MKAVLQEYNNSRQPLPPTANYCMKLINLVGGGAENVMLLYGCKIGSILCNGFVIMRRCSDFHSNELPFDSLDVKNFSQEINFGVTLISYVS